MHAHATEGAMTLVWIDGEEAIIVRWADRATVERVRPGILAHRHSAAHGPLGPSGHHGDGGADTAARVRREELRQFVEGVAARVPPRDDVTVVGPGILRGLLERAIRAEDRRHGRHRLVHGSAAERLSEQELVARVRALAGDAAPRRGVDGSR